LITVKYTLSSATLLSQPQLKPLWSSLAWLFATTSYLVSALRTTSHPPHKHQNCLSEIYICGLKVVQTPVLPKKKKQSEISFVIYNWQQWFWPFFGVTDTFEKPMKVINPLSKNI
jgi:hypothetical protein